MSKFSKLLKKSKSAITGFAAGGPVGAVLGYQRDEERKAKAQAEAIAKKQRDDEANALIREQEETARKLSEAISSQNKQVDRENVGGYTTAFDFKKRKNNKKKTESQLSNSGEESGFNI